MSAGEPAGPGRAPGPDAGAAAEPSPLTAGPPTRVDPESADARGGAAPSPPATGTTDAPPATGTAPSPPLPPGVRRYTRDGAAVTYEVALCRHAAECVRGLPQVFDTTRRPWIQPEHASADELEIVIARCPTRALKFERDPAIRGPSSSG